MKRKKRREENNTRKIISDFFFLTIKTWRIMSTQNKNSTERELVDIFESVIPHRIICTLGRWETKKSEVDVCNIASCAAVRTSQLSLVCGNNQFLNASPSYPPPSRYRFFVLHGKLCWSLVFYDLHYYPLGSRMIVPN